MVTETKINLEGVAVDNSNRVGLYGEDLANVAGVMNQQMTNLATLAANSQSKAEAITAMAMNKDSQETQLKSKNIILFSVLGFVGLLAILIFKKRR